MSNKVEVSANALKQILEALVGPPHLMRELQVIASLPPELRGEGESPLSTLIEEYNDWAGTQDNDKHEDENQATEETLP